jgi:uncharacterized protein (TIGR00255 family)
VAVQSMTGFGKGEASNDNYSVTVEMKSVNHRFRDIRFKMPLIFSSLELGLKEILTNRFKRGSFDIYVNYKRSEKKDRFEDLDDLKIKSFLKRIKNIVGEDSSLSLSPTDLMRNEFYKDVDLSKDQALMDLFKDAFTKAVSALADSRLEEGKKMEDVLLKHRDVFAENFSYVDSQADTFQKAVEDKLRKKFSDFSSELNIEEPRFLQEVVYYLEKLDVHEEINRIKSHLEKLSSLLVGGGEVGRQVDFMVQELNRETNTIGSKSNLSEISDRVVQMKVQLEKLREQGLNLE